MFGWASNWYRLLAVVKGRNAEALKRWEMMLQRYRHVSVPTDGQSFIIKRPPSQNELPTSFMFLFPISTHSLVESHTMDDRRLTIILPEALKAERPVPPAPTPVSAPKESQSQINHKLTKGQKQWDKQEKSKNALLHHAPDVHQRRSQNEGHAGQSLVVWIGSP
jgi:hypothetical protein